MINLRLYRQDGLHGEIRIGNARVELDDTETFLLSDLVDRVVQKRRGQSGDDAHGYIPLNGKIVNLHEAERKIIAHAMRFDKTTDEIAEDLGITRNLLHRRRKQYGLPMRTTAGDPV